MKNNNKPRLSRVHQIEFMDALKDQAKLSYDIMINTHRVCVIIKFPFHEIEYRFKKDIFGELYYDLPAWMVTKYFNTDAVRNFINSLYH